MTMNHKSYSVIIYTCLLAVLGINVALAQNITPELVDQLAREGNCTAPGIEGDYEFYTYDMAGYDRYYRIDTPFGMFPHWDHAYPRNPKPMQAMPRYALPGTYTFALTGFLPAFHSCLQGFPHDQSCPCRFHVRCRSVLLRCGARPIQRRGDGP